MKLKPLGELLKESFASYRTSIGHLIAIEVVPLVVMAVAAALAVSLFIAGFNAAGIAVVLVGIVLTIIAGVSSSIAMIQRIAHHRETLALRNSLEATRPYFLGYVWVGILSIVVSLIGFLLFIIPGIIIVVWISFAYFILILENVRGLDALTASKRLVSGLWWPVFGRLVASLVIYGSVSFALGFVCTVIVGESASNVLGTIFDLILSPFIMVYVYHLYLDVKRVKRTHAPEAEPVLA